MSLTFKLLSLAIRTAAKPIGNYIKRQAKEHDGFRRFAVNQAQRVHRIDMRMRLGILHDPEAQQRMHEREQKAAEEKKRKEETPTVRTEEEQRKFDEQKAKEAEGKKGEDKPAKVKIRPLSEARAIELGANFFSEAFIFGVAAGLLIWDSWRSRKKEHQRRDDVADRLEQLESEVESLRAKLDPDLETLHDLSERFKAAKRREQGSWWNPLSWRRTPEDVAIMEESHDHAKEAEEEEEMPIKPIRKTKVDAEKNDKAAKAGNNEAAKDIMKKAVHKAETKTAEAKPEEGKKPEAKEDASARVGVVAASNKSR